MKYIRPDQRVDSIVYMASETFDILLNSSQFNKSNLGFVETAIDHQKRVNHLSDVRVDRLQCAKHYLSYLIYAN